MIEPNFQIIINEKLKKIMGEGSKIIDKGLIGAFHRKLLDIVRKAMYECPVKTGRLRADIGHKFNEKEIQGIIYNQVEYSIYVHEGTQRMTARPYILNAIRDKGEIELKREIEREMLKIERGLI